MPVSTALPPFRWLKSSWRMTTPSWHGHSVRKNWGSSYLPASLVCLRPHRFYRAWSGPEWVIRTICMMKLSWISRPSYSFVSGFISQPVGTQSSVPL